MREERNTELAKTFAIIPLANYALRGKKIRRYA